MHNSGEALIFCRNKKYYLQSKALEKKNSTYKIKEFVSELTREKALEAYKEMPLAELMHLANDVKTKIHHHSKVTWIIDRNINTTNVCSSACSFCKFYRAKNSSEAYVTTKEEYHSKIDALYKIGGRQLLLQGGLNKELNLEYHLDLFRYLKKEYPDIKLHALSPTEVVFLSKQSGLSYAETLKELVAAGLDSLPGAGAEILTQRVRDIVSPAKCTAQEWVDLMKTAHTQNVGTTATMMFGQVETLEERIEHLFILREIQEQKPKEATGFISFIPWPFIKDNTLLEKRNPEMEFNMIASDYLRLIAISRIILYNIPNIQASLLTVGEQIAQLSLHAGANDLGSLLLEENVISEKTDQAYLGIKKMKSIISAAGFEDRERDQKFNFITQYNNKS